MEISRLRALQELGKRGSMAAVADAIHISSSAVSQQIAHLEAEAGIKLVERRGRGVRLTEAGERLTAYAEKIFNILGEAKAELAELSGTIAGEVRLAAFPSIASTLVPQAIRSLMYKFPKLRIVLTTMEPLEGVAALRAWQTDVAVIDDMTIDPVNLDANVEQMHIYRDLLYVALPPDHKLASSSQVDLRELRSEAWALDVVQNRYSDVIVRACQAAGFEPVVNAYCSTFEVMIALVEAGCCVSIVPGMRLKNYRGNIIAAPVFPELRRNISAAVRKGERRNPLIAVLLAALQDAAQSVTSLTKQGDGQAS
jgi:DNA-binding transcriptional LysR family regulator